MDTFQPDIQNAQVTPIVELILALFGVVTL